MVYSNIHPPLPSSGEILESIKSCMASYDPVLNR